ncbi:MAG: SDR family NAD(P)-dependent oxidoreductase, partial [Oscillospiraceae bacterium]|nr:SDR family NAD(P)-dependent oxidoreductase [Oscillospiraceae bacterium]
MMNLPLNIDFTGKVVVITGAGGVLCGDMARAMAQAGAKVAALDLNEEAVKKLADECKAEGY